MKFTDQLRSDIITVRELMDKGMFFTIACKRIGITPHVFRAHAKRAGVSSEIERKDVDTCIAQAQKLVSEGMMVTQACRKVNISTRTFYRKRTASYSEAEIRVAIASMYNDSKYSKQQVEGLTTKILEALHTHKVGSLPKPTTELRHDDPSNFSQ